MRYNIDTPTGRIVIVITQDNIEMPEDGRIVTLYRATGGGFTCSGGTEMSAFVKISNMIVSDAEQ
jgi:hypothetical protein